MSKSAPTTMYDNTGVFGPFHRLACGSRVHNRKRHLPLSGVLTHQCSCTRDYDICQTNRGSEGTQATPLQSGRYIEPLAEAKKQVSPWIVSGATREPGNHCSQYDELQMALAPRSIFSIADVQLHNFKQEVTLG